MNFTVFLNFFLVAVSLQSRPTTSLRLETKPSSEIGVSTKELEVSCRVEADEGPQTTLVIMINKDKRGNTIAEIREGHSVWTSSARYKVEGKVDNESSNRFLNVTVISPGHNDTGAYTCLVLSLKEDGQIKEESASKNITWEETSDSKLIILERKLNDLAKRNIDQITAITALETSNKQQKSKIIALEIASKQQKSANEQQKSKIKALEIADKQKNSQISDLTKAKEQQKSKIRALEIADKQHKSQISDLNKANEQQKSQISDLNRENEQQKMKDKQQALKIESLKADCEKQKLKISALFAEDEQHKSDISDLIQYTNKTILSLQKFQNSPIAFRVFKQTQKGSLGIFTSWPTTKYYFQQGGAFNPSTGVFKAPSDGLYAFNLFVDIVGSNRVYVYIRHNGVTVGWVHAWDHDDLDTSTHSTIMFMKEHDTVDLEVYSWSNLYKYVNFFFSGYRVTKS